MVRVFNHYFPLSILRLVSFDAISLLLAQILCAFVFYQGEWFSTKASIVGAAIVASTMVAVCGSLGLYLVSANESKWITLRRLALPLLFGFPIFHWVLFRTADTQMHLPSLAAGLGFAFAARFLMFTVGRSSAALISRRIMVIGVGPDAALVKETLEQMRTPGLMVVGFYSTDANPKVLGNIPANKVLLPGSSIIDTARQHNVSEIIIAVRERRGGVVALDELLACKLHGIKVTDLPGFFETYKSKVKIELLHESWFIFGEGFRQGRFRLFVKRSFDIAASTALLFVSLPVMLLAAIAIKLESTGPIIYRQQRVGLGGKCFDVLKFRSMCVDAERDGSPQWAKPGDARVTKIGRFMRLTRVDELPQLLTVLKGDMSLVGPRPERPFFVEQITKQVPFYAARHSVKPGVTGWAQVRHQYGASIDDASDKLEYDLFYVKNHTLFFDMLVLFYSVKVVLTAQGSR